MEPARSKIRAFEGRKLGEVLLGLAAVTSTDHSRALEFARGFLCTVGQACIRLGLIDDATLADALALQAGMPRVMLDGRAVSRKVLDLVPASLAARLRAIPLEIHRSGDRRETLRVAMARPKDLSARDELAFASGYPVAPAVAGDAEIEEAILRLYRFDARHGVPVSGLVDLGKGPGLAHVVARYVQVG